MFRFLRAATSNHGVLELKYEAQLEDKKSDLSEEEKRALFTTLKKQRRTVDILSKETSSLYTKRQILDVVTNLAILILLLEFRNSDSFPMKNIVLMSLIYPVHRYIKSVLGGLETQNREILNKALTSLNLETAIQENDSLSKRKDTLASLQRTISNRMDELKMPIQISLFKSQENTANRLLRKFSWRSSLKDVDWMEELYGFISMTSVCIEPVLNGIALLVIVNALHYFPNNAFLDDSDRESFNQMLLTDPLNNILRQIAPEFNPLEVKLEPVQSIDVNDTAHIAKAKIVSFIQSRSPLISILECHDRTAKEFLSFWSQNYKSHFFTESTKVVLEYIGGEEVLDAYQTESNIDTRLRQTTFYKSKI
jgi:hypothetical protein